MKITKRQLRRIIAEEESSLRENAGKGLQDFGSNSARQKLLFERGNPALSEVESQLRYLLGEYIDTYMMSMDMNPGDEADRRRVFQRLEAIAASIMG